MKKRWVFLLLAVVVGVGAVALNADTETVQVKTKVLKVERVEQTIACSGVVETAKATGVFLPVSCVIKQVFVKQGDRIRQGDVLAVIDKEATFAMADQEAVRIALAAMAEEITAPSAGVVVEVNAMEGASLERGAPCVLLALEQDLQVRVCLREKDLQVVRPGMTVRLSGDGFSQASYVGTLSDVSAAARADTGAGVVVDGIVKLKEDQVDASLRLGLTARVIVVTAVTEQGVLVPHEAVLSDDKGAYVYLLENGCARRRSLKTVGQVADGVLLSNRDLEGEAVICNPEKVSFDGEIVEEEAS